MQRAIQIVVKLLFDLMRGLRGGRRLSASAHLLETNLVLWSEQLDWSNRENPLLIGSRLQASSANATS